MSKSREMAYEALQFLFTAWNGCFEDDFHLSQINFSSSYPRNFSALMPKAHLAGLNFMLYACIRRNASSKCWMCLALVSLFTTMSSM